MYIYIYIYIYIYALYTSINSIIYYNVIQYTIIFITHASVIGGLGGGGRGGETTQKKNKKKLNPPDRG